MKIFSLLLFGFVLACSQGNSNKDYASDTGLAYSMESEEMTEEIPVTQQLTPQLQPVSPEQKIIKNAHLVFETQQPEKTHQKIIQLTQQYKGFLQSDNSGKTYNRIFRNIVIRVPTENFQSFIDRISEDITYFDQREISRKDVTEEYVDIQARLKAKKELENRFLELLKQAKNVKEMLEIERELSSIREEIEAKQGRLNYLQNRVSLSTVTIEFYKTTAESGIAQSYGQKMKNALKGGWNGVSVFLLGILYLWPLLLVVFIVIFVLRNVLKRKKKNSV